MATATRAGRVGTATAAVETRKTDDASDEEWEQNFTLLWIDLLENHGQALEVVNQLAAQMIKNSASSSSSSHGSGYSNGYRNGGGDQSDLSSTFSGENGFEQQKPTKEESVATLQETMQNMSNLLSSVEEIIRERLLGNAAKERAAAQGESSSHSRSTAAVVNGNKDTNAPDVESSSASTSKDRDSKQQTQNSLDAYLDGAAIEDDDPVFVNSVRGWNASGPPIQTNAYAPEEILLDGLELHDAMMQNNLRVAGMRSANHAYTPSGLSQVHTPTNGQSAHHHLSSSKNTHTPKSKSTDTPEKKAKKRRLSSAITSLPQLSEEQQQRHQHQQYPEPPSKQSHQHMKKKTANLTADKILQYRDGAHLCMYLVKWVDLEEPMWVLRKQCAPQAQQLIDDFNKKRLAKTRRMNRQRAEDAAEQQQLSGVDDSDDVDISTSPDGDIFIVDKIVDHRFRYGKKQYLVKWDGYESSDNTWEAATKLQDDVADVVDAYERKVALTSTEKQQGQRVAPESFDEPKISTSTSSNGKGKRQHHSAADSGKKRKRKHRVVMMKSAQRFADVDNGVRPQSDDENSTIDLENEAVVAEGIESSSELSDSDDNFNVGRLGYLIN